MQDTGAIPHLNAVLEDEEQDVMVRHGEADALDILTKYAAAPQPEIAETCQIAIDRIRHDKGSKDRPEADSKFLSVDPAPPAATDMTVEELRAVLLDASKPLFERYRAMFGLRNNGSEEAVLALVDGFQDSS